MFIGHKNILECDVGRAIRSRSRSPDKSGLDTFLAFNEQNDEATFSRAASDNKIVRKSPICDPLLSMRQA